jgi:hypothetical protein
LRGGREGQLVINNWTKNRYGRLDWNAISE